MSLVFIIFVKLLYYLSLANTLIYFAVDSKGTNSLMWFAILIVVTIANMIVDKLIGAQYTTVFDKPIVHIILNGLLLILTMIMYISMKEQISVLYMLIFGAHFVSQIYLKVKEFKVNRGSESGSLT